MLNRLKTIMNSKKNGNTLAETLIVMTVIGIVFTLSIGTFVADYNRNQTVVRLQKLYSTLSQAFDKSIAENGSPYTWDYPEHLSEQGSYHFFETYLRPNLMLMRDCKNSTEGYCNYSFKELDATEKNLNSTWARFFLNDGAFVAMQALSNKNYKVVYFYVDTNGKKRLNVVARDIFLFEYWIENIEHPEYVGKLRAFGEGKLREDLISETDPNNCNKNMNGNYCAALIMNDNWQIINGYPWAQARYVVQ